MRSLHERVSRSRSLCVARTSSLAGIAALGIVASFAAAQPTAPVARIFGAALECRDVQADEPAACAQGLLRYARAKVGDAFVAENRLGATSAELERVVAFNRTFERHDRSQRARKLAEIEARLEAGTLRSSERARLEEFRAILVRLASFEADVDAGVEPSAPIDEKTLRAWIETAKLNAALYARYGGSVGVAAHGPYAHGAMRTLILAHIEGGDIRILDPIVAARFSAALDAPPRFLHAEGAPDFTPFWERPIPPSYMPD